MTPSAKKILLWSKRLVSALRTIKKPQDDDEERVRLIDEKPLVQEIIRYQPPPSQALVSSSPTSDLNDSALSQHYAQVARDLRSSLPFSCRWFEPEDIKLICGGPIAAGGFADIWEATHNGRKVILKSYRCYISFDIARVAIRFYNEVFVSTLLRDGDIDVVPLVGVYSTEAHPFGIVYEHMDGHDLRQYLRNNPNVGRLQLVMRIAQCLDGMDGLGIVHDDIQTTNILVDKDGTPHIAGLGNARASESSWAGMVLHGASATHRTEANDMRAFGAVIFEVFTGRLPFFRLPGTAATFLLVSSSRPSRTDCHEVSDVVWRVIEGCWDPVESRRMEIEKVVTLLGEELRRILPPRV